MTARWSRTSFRRLSQFSTNLVISRTTPFSRSLSTVPSSDVKADQAAALVELREYTLHPHHVAAFLQATAQTAPLRTSHLPLRIFSLPETGDRLWQPTHTYYFAYGHEQRRQQRAALASQTEWQTYLTTVLPHIQSMSSNLWMEAPFLQPSAQQRHLLNASPELDSSADERWSYSGRFVSGARQPMEEPTSTTAIFEYRRYQLQLGYDTVPRFMEYYQAGLPSKLQAPGTDPSTSLVSVLYTEVGPLNQVMEIWHHGRGVPAMQQSRQAARQAGPWRQAVASMATLATHFTTSIHQPTSFSPLQ